MFHNFMMGFVVTLHLLAFSFNKGHQMFILSCLHLKQKTSVGGEIGI
jgi:hypothetical protein